MVRPGGVRDDLVHLDHHATRPEELCVLRALFRGRLRDPGVVRLEDVREVRVREVRDGDNAAVHEDATKLHEQTRRIVQRVQHVHAEDGVEVQVAARHEGVEIRLVHVHLRPIAELGVRDPAGIGRGVEPDDAPPVAGGDHALDQVAGPAAEVQHRPGRANVRLPDQLVVQLPVGLQLPDPEVVQLHVDVPELRRKRHLGLLAAPKREGKQLEVSRNCLYFQGCPVVGSRIHNTI